MAGASGNAKLERRFDELILPRYQELSSLVRRILWRKGVPDRDLEDGAQEVFLRAYQALGAYEDQNLPGWIGQIAANYAVDYRRRRREEPTEDAALEGLLPPTEGVDRQVVEGLMVARQLRAIKDGLSPSYVGVFLRALQGGSYQEIAEDMGLPLGTVQSRLHRARRQAAAVLGPGSSRAD